MNRRPIDWVAAQEMAMNGTCRDDSIMSGFTALLLHPDIFPDSRLQKDRREAKRAWLKVDLALSALIEGGNPWAQWINGVFLDIADHDFESAKDMYQLAADQGHALAQYNLGVLYEEEDQIENAEHYYRLAADQGHALAQYNLAMLFELDFETSMPHLEAAAAQGYAAALVYLGNLYLDSDVVEQDIERARHYFELAAKQGNIDGSVALEHITIGARGKDGSGGDQSGTSALSHGDDRDNENKNLYYQAHDEIMMLEKDDDLKVFLLQDLRRKQQTRAMTLLDVWNLYKQARDEIMKLEKDRARRVFLLYFRRKQQKRAVTLLDVWNLYKQARDEIMKLEKGHDLEVFLLQELQRKFRVAYPQFTSSFLDVWNLHKQARDEIRARRVFLLYLLLVYLHRKQQKRAVTLLDALHLYKQARDEIIKLMTRHSDKEKNTVPS
jgi:TPR repeat protein